MESPSAAALIPAERLLFGPGPSPVPQRVLRALAAPTLGHLDPQYLAIIALWEQDQLTVKALSEKLFLEPSTVTPMLKRLEAMGYVRRERDKEDERNVRISLTDAGRALREKGLGFGKQTVAASGLSPEEFPLLQKAIVQLRDNLIDAAGKTEG